uniref:Uncharacterized protein n=1 Tax=Xenopus tropicalis TaxID=8364 RepID=A0A803JR76_XENTR
MCSLSLWHTLTCAAPQLALPGVYLGATLGLNAPSGCGSDATSCRYSLRPLCPPSIAPDFNRIDLAGAGAVSYYMAGFPLESHNYNLYKKQIVLLGFILYFPYVLQSLALAA